LKPSTNLVVNGFSLTMSEDRDDRQSRDGGQQRVNTEQFPEQPG
jgi:hypothetical protein